MTQISKIVDQLAGLGAVIIANTASDNVSAVTRAWDMADLSYWHGRVRDEVHSARQKRDSAS